MALPAHKKRKTEHVSSDDESEDGSFASFGGQEEDAVNGAGSSSDAEEIGVVGEGSDSDTGGKNLEDGDLDQSADEEEVEDTPAQTEALAPQSKAIAKSVNRKAEPGSMGGNLKSSVFRLQVDELLDQVRPKHGAKETALDDALHGMRTAIAKIAAREPLLVEEAERALLKERIVTPFPQPRPPKDAKYKLAYAKPANINVVGSYILKTNSRANAVVEADMVVAMPSSLFQDKDYLNYRYFYKRAYYLACLAAGLKASQKGATVQYALLQDDPLRPVIVVKPATATANKDKDVDSKPALRWQINVMLSVGSDVFSPEKLKPHKNCVRQTEQADPQAPQPSTPRYNASLRSDMLVSPYLKLLHATASSCPAFRDVCLLGSTWLRQRGFGHSTSAGGFGNFEWSALIALLLQGGGPGDRPMLSAGYSSHQLFKATLQLLASKDLKKQAFVVGGEHIGVKPIGDGSPMIWDNTRQHNLLFKMSPSSYKLLRHEAQTTLKMLNDQLFDGFESTFIRRIDHIFYRFDAIVQLGAATVAPKGQQGAADGHAKLYEVLKRGLGDRANFISVHPPAAKPWAISAAKPARSLDAHTMIGLGINPDTAARTVDHGPSAESKAEAASFRQFWGEKAELRRFKDGSIHESLVWAANEVGQSVLEQIVRYLLGRHFSKTASEKAVFSGDGFAKLLRQPHGTAPFQPIMEAFKDLERDIRSLEDLPLTIRQISPADPQLSYTSINPPSNASKHPRTPASVLLQFEGSGRWPDDLQAIQRTKIAFLLRLSSLLQTSKPSEIATRIGLENPSADILNQAYLDITYLSTQTSFRLRIHHDREATLLSRDLQNPSLDPRSKDLAATGLAAYKRTYIAQPTHTQALARLCTTFPALSLTIRLLKKWFASHLLSTHFPDPLIELFATNTFTSPHPYAVPATPQVAFLRTLAWLARWDWRTDPLIADMGTTASLKPVDVAAIRTKFEAWRALDPGMNRVAIFAASSVDREGTSWTDGCPAKVVAGRMSALARAAREEIEGKGLELEAGSLFVSPLGDFDVVLHLDPSVLGAGKRKKEVFKNLEVNGVRDEGMVGFEPVVMFLQELEEIYGQAVVWFYGGSEGPQVVAGLWSPVVTGKRGWKVNLAYNTRPVREGEEMVAKINKEAVLAEIAELGGGMVTEVEVNR